MTGVQTCALPISAGPAWTRLTTILFAVVAVVTLALGVVLLVVGESPARPLGVTVTTLLGVAMGLQASVARFIAIKDVTTVVVTSTITGLAADSIFGSGKSRAGDGGSARRASAVVTILAGAAAGAALLQWHLGTGLLLAGGLIAAVTIVGGLHARGATAS